MARTGFKETCPPDCKVYVGDLGNNGDRRELEDAFGRYGPLRNVWVARNPPGFAFVEFEASRDAEDASRELDGRTLCGRRVRVEISSGRTKPKHFGGGRGGRDGRDYDRRDGGGRYGRDDRGGPGGGRYGRDDRGGRDRGGGRGGRSRSRSRSPRERRRSRSSRDRPERDVKRAKSGSASPRNEDSRRRGRGSEEKNGSPDGEKE